MREILDAPEPKKEVKKTFSRMGMLFFVITLFLAIKMNTYIETRVLMIEEDSVYPKILAFGLLISSLLGLLISGISFYKKEPNSIIKWIGIIFNLLFFVLLYGSVIFAALDHL